jgi:hypothetical protein
MAAAMAAATSTPPVVPKSAALPVHHRCFVGVKDNTSSVMRATIVAVVVAAVVASVSVACTPDFDGDNLCKLDDNCPFVSNVGQTDTDNDGVGGAPARMLTGTEATRC